MGTFPARVLCVFPACVPGVCVARSRSLLKLSQAGKCWNVGKYWERCRRRSGVGGCSQEKITGGGRWQHLTIYIENVIISVTMITKKLFVTRAPNLRCKPFFLFRI